jgi:hypothetical protein
VTIAPARLSALLFAVSAPGLVRASRGGGRRLLLTLALAEQIKLAAAFATRRDVERRHPGGSDPDDLHAAGAAFATHVRAGRRDAALDALRTIPFEPHLPLLTGTKLVRLLTGATYLVSGPSKQNGYLVSSWLGFWGQCLFVRAFAVAVPDGRTDEYARLVLFFPSVVYWTSTIGKESLTCLGLGVTALGAAHTSAGAPRKGVPLALTGAGLTLLLRPHVVPVLGRRVSEDPRRAPDEPVHVPVGGSDFTPPSRGGVRGMLERAITVLYRPFPHEARTAHARIAAVEGMLLLGLTVARAPRITRALLGSRRRPYLALSAAMTGALGFVLRDVGNFGSLHRQRVPLLPFFFVLLSALPSRRTPS